MGDLTDHSGFAYLLLHILCIYYIRIYGIYKVPYQPEYKAAPNISGLSVSHWGILKKKTQKI